MAGTMLLHAHLMPHVSAIRRMATCRSLVDERLVLPGMGMEGRPKRTLRCRMIQGSLLQGSLLMLLLLLHGHVRHHVSLRRRAALARRLGASLARLGS